MTASSTHHSNIFLSGPVMVACVAGVSLELQRSEKLEFVATREIRQAKNEERGRGRGKKETFHKQVNLKGNV